MVAPVVSAGRHRASSRASTRPTAGPITSVSAAWRVASRHHRCRLAGVVAAGATGNPAASVGARSTARLMNPNGKLVLSWNRRSVYTPRRLGTSPIGTLADCPGAACSRYACGWRVNPSTPSSSDSVSEIVGQNRLALANPYVIVSGSPTVPASGRPRVTRTFLSVTRLIDTLTTRMPIISPNTPNSRLAWVLIAATPMNSISVA